MRQIYIPEKFTYYDHTEPCPECGAKPVRRYKSTNGCTFCVHHTGDPVPDDGYRNINRSLSENKKYYYPRRCYNGGHWMKLKIGGSGRCLVCNPTADYPRLDELYPDMLLSKEQATIAGSPVFNPGSVCKNGHKSWRYVSNGNCVACHKGDAPGPHMKDYRPPYYRTDRVTVISKADAQAREMKYYRTGKQCKHGHDGWRTVVAGQCVDCMRGVLDE